MSKYISRRGEVFQFGESAWRLGGVVGILKEVRTGVTGREDLEWKKNRIFVERVNEGDWGQYIVYKEFNFFLWLSRSVALWDEVIF